MLDRAAHARKHISSHNAIIVAFSIRVIHISLGKLTSLKSYVFITLIFAIFISYVVRILPISDIIIKATSKTGTNNGRI